MTFWYAKMSVTMAGMKKMWHGPKWQWNIINQGESKINQDDCELCQSDREMCVVQFNRKMTVKCVNCEMCQVNMCQGASEVWQSDSEIC